MDNAAMQGNQGASVSSVIRAEIASAGGGIAFSRFMALALYAPGLGYYSRAARPFGSLPGSGSDFVTAPELSPHFGRALARQVRQALEASGTDEVFEFGAGSGALAAQLIETLGAQLRRYTIVELSAGLRGTQAGRLAQLAPRVQWLDTWPEAMRGVVVGNEVLDAMPVDLLHFDGGQWSERGVSWEADRFVWRDRPTELRPPADAEPAAGAVTEIHREAEAFVATLAERLEHGAAFFIDYGFPAAEYYHPQRQGGTLMCHRGHRMDMDPLVDVGEKDITAHVNWTGIALAAQEAGMEVIGYTSQAHFLLNCGILDQLATASVAERANAQKLLHEHEMGELFKVMGFARGVAFDPVGFVRGDRTHTL